MTDNERAELARLQRLAYLEGLPIVAQAWEAVRKPGDAEWLTLPYEMKHRLIALTEKYVGGSRQEEGDYAPEGFYAKIVQLSFPPILQGEDEFPVSRKAESTNRRVGIRRLKNVEVANDQRMTLGRRWEDANLPSTFSPLTSEISVGDPIVHIDSRPPMKPRGLDYTETIEPNPPVDGDIDAA